MFNNKVSAHTLIPCKVIFKTDIIAFTWSSTIALQQKQTALEEEKFELDTEVDKSSGTVSDKEREYQVLMKDYEYAREREAVLMGDR